MSATTQRGKESEDEEFCHDSKNSNDTRANEPYLGFGRHLESGGGVGTLPSNLRFRKYLKSAT